MTIIDLTHDLDVEFAASLAEPCSEFTAFDGSPVCAGCGWLDDEHGPSRAVAPKRAPRMRYPAARRRFAAAG